MAWYSTTELSYTLQNVQQNNQSNKMTANLREKKTTPYLNWVRIQTSNRNKMKFVNSPSLTDQYILCHTYTAVDYGQVFHHWNAAASVYRENNPACNNSLGS